MLRIHTSKAELYREVNLILNLDCSRGYLQIWLVYRWIIAFLRILSILSLCRTFRSFEPLWSLCLGSCLTLFCNLHFPQHSFLSLFISSFPFIWAFLWINHQNISFILSKVEALRCFQDLIYCWRVQGQ